MKYAIACRTPWFWDAYARRRPTHEVLEIRTPAELNADALGRFGPRWVFFPHWSHLVPPELTDRFECVCFHSTPVPYGRGGSPIQNMIVRGHEETVVTALQMTSQVDAGPVYARRPVSLLGGLDEIMIRIAGVTVDLIDEIVATQPTPQPQEGEVVVFKRRAPAESALPADGTLDSWFDLIRMLDSDEYPRAFIDFGGMRLEFSRPTRRLGRLEAQVVIKARP